MPELRVDAAIVNGPLPVMTLFTKTLWRGTPHGFDEALPKGHEDWSFWLQLTRLPLQAGEIATRGGGYGREVRERSGEIASGLSRCTRVMSRRSARELS